MNKKLNTLYKVLITSFGTLAAVTVTGKTIAFENRKQINKFFSVTESKYVPADKNDNVDTEYFKSDYKTLEEEMAFSRSVSAEAEAEGAVLLKNEGQTLPLKGQAKVSLFGVASVDPVYGGTGSAATNIADADTFKSALETTGGFVVNPTLYTWYANNLDAYRRVAKTDPAQPWAGATGLDLKGAPWTEVKNANGTTFAQYKDAAIVVFARTGGEGTDLPVNENSPVKLDGNAEGDYLALSDNERALLAGLKAEKDAGNISKIVVLLNSANAMETGFINDSQYGIDAAMWIGSVGLKGLTGVANILSGKIAPSGGLSDTYYTDNAAYNPVLKNFGDITYSGAVVGGLYGNRQYQEAGAYGKYVAYQEGVYLGYKYVETRYEDKILKQGNAGDFNYSDAVSYPFGYGLTYADFEMSDYEVVANNNDTYTLSVKVTNKSSSESKLSGKKNVQFYMQKPYTQYDIDNKIEKPSVELVAFGKTKVLNPGESEVVKATIKGRDFASYDANTAKTYVVDGGHYYITAAANSHEAVNNILAAKNKKVADGMDAEGKSSLVKDVEKEFDDKKYSGLFDENGKETFKITNEFDHADPNKTLGENNKVTFMSRHDWVGTYPTGAKMELTQEMYDSMKAMMTVSTEGQDISYPTYGAGNGKQIIDVRGLDYEDEAWDDVLDNLSFEDTVKLVSSGFRSTTEMNSVGKPATVDSNGPCGLTDRYGLSPSGLTAKKDADKDKNKFPTTFPCNGIIASSFNAEFSNKVGLAIGEDALWAGYSGLYGPCSNIHRSPYEGRAFEYYSEDSVLSGLILSAEVKGITSKGCYVYNKHFCLNEQETNRSGICTWATEQTIRETYLKAFALPIEETPFQCVMTSFNRLGLVPTVLDTNLNDHYLRGELGMLGINVTDYWGGFSQYATLPSCLMHGVNLPDGNLTDGQISEIVNAYKSGYGLLAKYMRESAHRILYMVANSNAMNGVAPGGKYVASTPAWQVTLITFEWVFIGLTAVAAVMLCLNLLSIFPKKD